MRRSDALRATKIALRPNFDPCRVTTHPEIVWLPARRTRGRRLGLPRISARRRGSRVGGGGAIRSQEILAGDGFEASLEEILRQVGFATSAREAGMGCPALFSAIVVVMERGG